ncbi:DUF3597 domain-containing protein [Devosia sp. MC532]|uniref:DUF3597 domain-containing protein n=1 Tax=Devosia sp. MC532 TaxID=2799788 RepID=UPI0018F4CBBE|nr:DUF3597 domain-containing protein [Devosia sp. MC532]MBJ7576859.1 DUF3597 domain-containing protein [Devosia sp. MC532]
MGFFDAIKEKIFGAPKTEQTSAPQGLDPKASHHGSVVGTTDSTPVAPTPTRENLAAGTAHANAAPPASGASAPASGAASQASVDVAAILDAAVAESGQQLNWKTSIVDLMKALGIDSSLTARKELADELGYTGDKSDSATMNIWLHKQVISQLKANGGTVPANLLD